MALITGSRPFYSASSFSHVYYFVITNKATRARFFLFLLLCRHYVSELGEKTWLGATFFSRCINVRQLFRGLYCMRSTSRDSHDERRVVRKSASVSIRWPTERSTSMRMRHDNTSWSNGCLMDDANQIYTNNASIDSANALFTFIAIFFFF